MVTGRRPLSVRDVAALLQRSPRTRDAILVGGQALNIWAVRFGLAAETAALSDDIDFFGSQAQAIAAGLDWNAKVHTPSPDDATPNSAVVIVGIDEEERAIDFMSSIAGVESKELDRWASTVVARNYDFRVMHPLHVLQSQLENVYGSLRRRDEPAGEYFVGRSALAIQVVERAIVALLDGTRARDALKAAARVAELASKRPALEAWRRDKVDLLTAIPKHKAWPRQFIDKRLPQINVHILRKREEYVAHMSKAHRPMR